MGPGWSHHHAVWTYPGSCCVVYMWGQCYDSRGNFIIKTFQAVRQFAWTQHWLILAPWPCQVFWDFFFRRILELTLLLFKVGLPGRYLNPVVPKWALLDPINEPLEEGSEGSLKSTVPGWYDGYMSFKRSIQWSVYTNTYLSALINLYNLFYSNPIYSNLL